MDGQYTKASLTARTITSVLKGSATFSGHIHSFTKLAQYCFEKSEPSFVFFFDLTSIERKVCFTIVVHRLGFHQYVKFDETHPFCTRP
jgi:hypothetical protein